MKKISEDVLSDKSEEGEGVEMIGVVFATSDLFLASFLKGKGYAVVDVKKEGAKTIFCFSDNEDRKKLVLQFYNCQSSIEPLAFVRNWRDLKSLVYNT